MKKWIAKYYQEIIAVVLVVGFWGTVWAYNSYKDAAYTEHMNANSYVYSPGVDQ